MGACAVPQRRYIRGQAGTRKERGHLLRLFARGLAAPQADLIQVAAAIVADQAIIMALPQETVALRTSMPS